MARLNENAPTRCCNTGEGNDNTPTPKKESVMDSIPNESSPGGVHHLVYDLIRRVENAVREVAHLAVDSGITFEVEDIVRKVEDGLPEHYPAPTVGAQTRADLIRKIAQDVLSGELYEDAAEEANR